MNSKLEIKRSLFYTFLDEGWSPTCSKGRAKISASEHIELKALYPNYDNVFRDNYKRAMKEKNQAWFKFEKGKT